MAYLTESYIRKAIKDDVRFDQNIETDEHGKAIVWLNEGWTWCKADGDRTVEGFIISSDNADEAPRDTVAYWEQCIRNIERIA